LIYQYFKTPFSKLEAIVKSEFEIIYFWDWFILKNIGVNIVIFIFTDVGEAYEFDVFIEGHPKNFSGSASIVTNLFSKSICPKI